MPWVLWLGVFFGNCYFLCSQIIDTMCMAQASQQYWVAMGEGKNRECISSDTVG